MAGREGRGRVVIHVTAQVEEALANALESVKEREQVSLSLFYFVMFYLFCSLSFSFSFAPF